MEPTHDIRPMWTLWWTDSCSRLTSHSGAVPRYNSWRSVFNDSTGSVSNWNESKNCQLRNSFVIQRRRPVNLTFTADLVPRHPHVMFGEEMKRVVTVFQRCEGMRSESSQSKKDHGRSLLRQSKVSVIFMTKIRWLSSLCRGHRMDGIEQTYEFVSWFNGKMAKTSTKTLSFDSFLFRFIAST